jgi:uncharacterized membrane protein
MLGAIAKRQAEPVRLSDVDRGAHEGHRTMRTKTAAKWRARLAVGAAAVAAIVGVGTAAKADFNVCNKTKERVAVALGYRQQGEWFSQGWWNLEPGRCQAVIAGKLTETKYYLYADAKGGAWYMGGPYRFCVKGQAFKITGNTNCESHGSQRQGFREVNVGNNSAFTYEIYEPGQ